jgi:hypothetical protein
MSGEWWRHAAVSASFAGLTGSSMTSGVPHIVVSIAVQNAHSGVMHGEAIDRMMTYSFWGLGFLISAGIILAVFIW